MLCECVTPLPRGASVNVQRCSLALRCAALSISTLMASVIQLLTDLSQWKQPLFNIQKHISFSVQSLAQNETHFPDYHFILSSSSFISVHRIKCQQYVVCEMRRWMWMEKCWFFEERENVQWILTMNMWNEREKVCLIMKKEEKYIILFKIRKFCFFLCEILSLHHFLENHSFLLIHCVIFTVKRETLN